MDAKPDWSDLQLLAVVANAGSMLRAGRRLGLAASTVGRRLDALERCVGALLVQRGPAGVRVTEAGRSLVACSSEFDVNVARALRDLPRAGGELMGTVRVSAGDGFANAILGVMRRVRQRHPQVAFELAVEDRVVALARGEADVAVRTVHQRESSLVYRQVRALEYGLFADAGYLAERGGARRLSDLAKHDWVGFAPPLDRLPVQRWLAARCGRPPALETTTFAAVLAAARAGLGLAALPVAVAPALVAVLPGTELPPLPVWIVADRDARKKPHVAAFIEALRDELDEPLPGSAAAGERIPSRGRV